MKSTIAHTYLYQLIIIYVAIVFAILFAAVNYYKAYKVNNIVISTIEKYEGYNQLAQNEITNKLNVFGYTKDTVDCPDRNGKKALSNNGMNHPVCVYEYEDDTVAGEAAGSYYNYSVVSYIYVDIPYMRNLLKIPVHTKGERIYNFDE